MMTWERAGYFAMFQQHGRPHCESSEKNEEEFNIN